MLKKQNRVVKSALLAFSLSTLAAVMMPNIASAQTANRQCGSEIVTFDEIGPLGTRVIPLADAFNTTVVANQYVTGSLNNPLPAGAGVAFSFVGGPGDFGTVYNSNTGTNGQDPDLEGGDTGNILIVEENGTVANPGAPDDVVGGQIIIDYELPIAEFAVRFVDFEEPDVQFEFYDLDAPITNDPNAPGFPFFPVGEGNPVVIPNGDLVDGAVPYGQTGCVLADDVDCDIDNGITTANGTGAGLIDIAKIDRVIVNMATGPASGGIDNVRIELACGTLTLEGNVFNDLDALTDNQVDGTGTNAGGLFASLVTGGTVVASVPVAADGTYDFGTVDPNTSYTIQLNTTMQTVDPDLTDATLFPPSAPDLPAGWINTGENLGAGTGSDGTVDGILAVDTVTESITNANFGIQQAAADIGDLIFYDLNGDGIFNGADSGIPNVDVELCFDEFLSVAALDDFNNESYANNPTQWVGSWVELGDSVADFATTGDITVTNNITDPPGDELDLNSDTIPDGASLTRTIDFTGVSGANSATISIDWRGSATGNYEDEDRIEVQVNTGSGFTTLHTFVGEDEGVAVPTPSTFISNGDNDPFSGTLDIDFDPQGSANVQLRFVLTQLNAGDENLFIDEIRVNGTATVPVETCITTTTVADGSYLFVDQLARDYTVTVDPNGTTLPSTVNPVPTGDPQGALDGVSDLTLAGVDNLDQDFGYQPVIAISGNVSRDDTGNGVGDVNLTGVTVQLYSANASGDPIALLATTTTNASGDYQFTGANVTGGLPEGDYAVIEIDPAGLRAVNDGDASPDADAANLSPLDNLIPVSVVFGEVDADNDFVDAATASLEGTVWLDEDLDGILDTEETGITQVIVQLFDGPTLIATTTTDSNGDYSFDNLFPSTYDVVVTDGSGTPLETLTNTAGTGGDEPKTGIVVNAGDMITDVDFGYIPRNGLGAIGDRVWADANNNGVQDPGEAGIENVVLQLFDQNGDPVVLPSGATVTTNANGDYLFSDVPFGEDYVVQIVGGSTIDGALLVSGGTLDGYTATTGPQSEGGLVSNPVTIENTLRVVTDLDFGFDLATLNTLSDTVWFDEDADGLLNGNEQGIPGITVDIIDNATNEVIGTATTDENGDVSFTGLPNGTYRLRITDNADGLDGLNGTTTEGVARLSDPVTFSGPGAETDDQNSFGYNNPGIISGTVYSDPDDLANTNNDQDPGEAGIAGTTVELFLDGVLFATTTTDATGDYSFDGLAPGNYTVVVTPPGGTQTEDPDGVGGRNNETDITLGVGESSVENDFGYFNVPNLFDISGVVFLDIDKDGVEEKPGDTGIQGITLALIDNATGEILSTTTTADGTTDADGDGDIDADDLGYYEFTGLPAGDYRVAVTDESALLAGYDITSGLDVLSATIVAADVTDVDFGYIKEEVTGSIAGEIFIDEDNDGFADDDEFNLTDVTVYLCFAVDAPCTSGNAIQTTTTDANGDYVFTDLPPGTYEVGPEPTDPDIPAGLTLTVDPDPVALSEGENVTDVDIGYVPAANKGVLSGFVWVDANNNGQFDSGEAPIGGVEITVFDNFTALDIDSGAPVTPATTTTKPDGTWIISDIDIDAVDGDENDLVVIYNEADIPTNLDFDQPSNFPTGDDRYVDVDLTDDADNNITNLDFGFPPETGTTLGSISGTIYSDGDEDDDYTSGNGIDGELGGVTINLVSGGVVIATTTTTAPEIAPDGIYSFTYSFTGLQPGTYDLVITDLSNELQDLNPNAETLGTGIVINGNEVRDQDAGYVQDQRLNSIGNRFWFDSGIAGSPATAGDGIYQDGEPGIEGIIVQCWLDDGSESANGNINDPTPATTPTPVPGLDNLIRTVKTDENGEYYCTSLPAGDYIVTVADSAGFVEATDGTTIPGSTADGNAKPWTYALSLGAIDPNLTADFGVRGVNSLSGVVFVEDPDLLEPDDDGTLVPGPDEPMDGTTAELDGTAGGLSADSTDALDTDGDNPVPVGVPVVLLVQVNGQFVEIASTVTGVDGSYSFSGLPDGLYRVEVRPSGSVIDGFGQTGDPDLIGQALPENRVCDSDTIADCDNATSTPIDLDSDGNNASAETVTGINFGYQENFVTTPVTVTYFSAASVSGGVEFTWETANEVGHLGYQIYARGADDWVLLNDDVILSEGGAMMDVRTHSYTATGSVATDATWFALVDVATNEELTLHGPYRLGETHGQPVVQVEAFDWSGIELRTPNKSEVSESVNARLQRLLEPDERDARSANPTN